MSVQCTAAHANNRNDNNHVQIIKLIL